MQERLYVLGSIILVVCVVAGLVALGILFVLYGPDLSLPTRAAHQQVSESSSSSLVLRRAGSGGGAPRSRAHDRNGAASTTQRARRPSEIEELRQQLRELRAARERSAALST